MKDGLLANCSSGLIDEVINLVHDNPLIYDKANASYKNNSKKSSTYKALNDRLAICKLKYNDGKNIYFKQHYLLGGSVDVRAVWAALVRKFGLESNRSIQL